MEMYSKSILFNKIFLILVSSWFFTSCQNNLSFTKVDVTHVLLDSSLNIRALEIHNNKVYNATSRGEIYSFDTKKPDLLGVDQYSSKVDSVLYPNFRSMAVINDNIFAITIGSPALLFKNGKVVYKQLL